MTAIFTHIPAPPALPLLVGTEVEQAGKQTELWPLFWGLSKHSMPCLLCVTEVAQVTLLTCPLSGKPREGGTLFPLYLESTLGSLSLPFPFARALDFGYLTQDMIDDYEPALMFTIPRLAIVW